MTTTKRLLHAVALVASLGFAACGPLCGFGEHQAQEYPTSQACGGSVEAPPALGLATAVSPTCVSPLHTVLSCGVIPSCLQAPSADSCPTTCVPIDVVSPSNEAAGVDIAIDLPPSFAGERTFAANELRIRAFAVNNRSTPLNPGEALTVTDGSVKVRMVPNELTATVSLELMTAAGDPITLQNVQYRDAGQYVDYCARAD
jgi:hypothetical protein